LPDIDTLPAGPDLDVLVAEKVMGWKRSNDENYSLMASSHWSPSTDIAAAWQVAEKIKSLDWQVEISFSNKLPEGDEDSYYVGLQQGDDNAPWKPSYRYIQTWAQAVSLAICRAALKAVNA
jgi:hypothetical protein